MVGMRIGSLMTHADHQAAAALLARVWGMPPECPPFPADLIRSLQHAGACALGAWRENGNGDGDGNGDEGAAELVGVTIATAGSPRSESIYSLVAGVVPEAAGLGVGRALKFAQRDWALERGARSIVWTYDPLIRRNAHFNLDRLGAGVTDFLEDYYPPMADAINAGDLTDRCYVEWDISPDAPPRPDPGPSERAPLALSADASGEPQRGEVSGEWLRVWIPEDIEALRRTDAALAMRWRLAYRETFRALFGAGYRPVRTEQGHYVFGQVGPTRTRE